MRSAFLALLLSGLCAVAQAQEPSGQNEPGAEPAGPPDRIQLVLNTGGHASAPVRLFFTPDGQRLISAGMDGTIQVWNAQSGERERLWWLPGPVENAALSPDGKTLAVAGGLPPATPGHHAPIWLVHLEDGGIRSLSWNKGPKVPVSALAFAPQGDRLAFALGPTVWVWDVKENRHVLTLPRKGPPVWHLTFSPDGNRLLVSPGDDGIYDVSARPDRGPLIVKDFTPLQGHGRAWSPDGKRLLTVTSRGNLGNKRAVLNICAATGELLQSYPVGGPGSVVRLARFLDEQHVLVVFSGGEFGRGRILNLPDGWGRQLFAEPSQAFRLIQAATSPDGRLIAVTGDPAYQLSVWRRKEGQQPAEELWRVGDLSRSPRLVGWSGDGKAIAWGAHFLGDRKDDRLKNLQRGFHLGELKVLSRDELKNFRSSRQTPDGWALRSARPDVIGMDIYHGEQVIKRVGGEAGAWTFFPDGQGGMRLIHGYVGKLFLYQADAGKRLASFGNHPSVRDVGVSPDGRFLLVARGSPEMWLYRLDQPGSPLLKLFFTETDWIIWTEQGYYAASPGGEKLIGWRVANGPNQLASFYPAERFRKQLYRPDVIKLVLEKGNVAEALRAADTARGIQSAPVDLEKLLPPKAQLQLLQQQGARVTVQATATAQTQQQPIVSLRLLLAGRPLPDAAGVQKFAKGLPRAEATWTITLPPGKHQLSVLARSRDVAGVSPPLQVEHVDPTQQAALHVLTIGINAYATESLRLQYARADAEATAKAFAASLARDQLFKPGMVTTLVDEQATSSAIFTRLAKLRQQTRPPDLVVVFFAGHGVQGQDDFYLLTAESKPRKFDQQTALAGKSLRQALAAFPCQVLLLLDACHSSAALKAFRPATDELTRNLTEDEVGVTVLCAAMAHQKAQERLQQKHGLFTAALLEALHDNEGVPFNRQTRLMYVHHLYSYIFDQVSNLTGQQQSPFLSLPWTVESYAIRKVARKPQRNSN